MIDWIATWARITEAWAAIAADEDPGWIGEKLCALTRCDNEAALKQWAEDVGLEGIEKMIVRREAT